MRTPFSSAALLFLCPFLLLSCAGQVPPPGGPVDTIPPAVVRTEPDTNAVRVQTNSVLIEFSKYVDRRTVEESIFISPYVGTLEYDWSGREVTIRFGEPLRRNTTYVINIGTDVADVRAGNRMASGYTLAFSTGDSIDRGFLSGRVFDEKPDGVMIFAYQLQGRRTDTLSPARVRPDYIMQTGKDGAWTLANIALGPYRLFAVRDEYRNLLYDRQVDQFGVGQGDQELTPVRPRIDGLNFRLSREDTTMPFITGARALNRFFVQVRLSEPPDSITFASARFVVTDTLAARTLPELLTYRDQQTPGTISLVLSSPLDSAAGYSVTARGILDRAGNPLDTSHAGARFSGTATPDTARPVLRVVGMSDSMRAVPLDRPLDLSFSEAVRQAPAERAVRFVDSTQQPVPSSLHWSSPASLILTPRKELSPLAWYQLIVQLDSISDLRGNGYNDTMMHLRFQTMDVRTTGSIEGTVVDTAGKGRIFLTARETAAGRGAAERTVRLDNPGPFLLDRLSEGYYVLSAFRDADSSGSYSFGLPFPYRPSERFVVSRDTLKVRARWGVEGVTVGFGQ